MKFTEHVLEKAFISLVSEENIPHVLGENVPRASREDVLIKDDLRTYLANRYKSAQITTNEIEQIIRKLEQLPASDLYDTNKQIIQWIQDGFVFKREDHKKKDLHIELIDYSESDANNYKMVNQLELDGFHTRIPDGILYINGLPVVVFEFKSAIRENATTYKAYEQVTIRYRRDIPKLFKYNAFCVLSDGVNTKAGSFFAGYDFFYAWRKITGTEKTDAEGINSMETLIRGMLNHNRLRDIIQNFIFFPDKSSDELKIVCRYPQYYASRKLFENIKKQQRPHGDGKGGTYFGTTGCGKSYTMLFLSRLLMKSKYFENPTLILITDRTDLDTQLSKQFTKAKEFLSDDKILSVESRNKLKEHLEGIESGGVFLTTIHKFTEEINLLTKRTNVICISDEAHRSQVNLNQKVKVTEKGVQKTYGFAKYLHDSLPNATYVGFTGTPIDATLDVFGEIVDTYTMSESVRDGITVKIVYEGRSAKVNLNEEQLKKIEEYYKQCADEGSNDYQIEASKKATTKMNVILGDPDRLKELAKDFVTHYENRVMEGSSVKGKVMFVSSKREIAYDFYKQIIEIRPEWTEIKACEDGAELTEQEQKKIKPMEKIKMVMTRGKDDPEVLYKMLGTKEYRQELDRQFKNGKSNFKIAIVVDMWLTGFDVPFLDTIYIDKPIQRHNLIQTISRVNRKYIGKEKGLVVDYIGIKSDMNKALSHYNNTDNQKLEGVEESVNVVKDELDVLAKMFHKFDDNKYFKGSPVEQLHALNLAVEYVQQSDKLEKRFMSSVKRLKAGYDICSGSELLTQEEKDRVHFYLAIRSIIFKLNKGDAPDTTQMNAKVLEMIKEALASEGVEEIFKMGEDSAEIDVFDDEYLDKISKIKMPNTKIKLLQQLLAKAIDDFKKVNKTRGIDFSKKMRALVERYNERKEQDIFDGEVFNDITSEIMDDIMKMYNDLKKERNSYEDMGINFEEKAFYDILKGMIIKYEFEYPEDKLLSLSKAVKVLVDDKAKYTDWDKRDDIKAELEADLIVLLAENDYPPVDKYDEVYKEIFEQAQNFKKHRGS